jgi:DNA-binding MarR family transcriptional regulator
VATSQPASPEAPALDLPEGGLLGPIVRLNLVINDVLETIAAGFGLTFPDYLVLGVVRRSPEGRSAPTAIAGVLGRTTGGMSLTLDRLAAAGLLLRTPSSEDGRRVVVELTDEGEKLAAAVNNALHEWEAALALPLTRSDAVRTLDLLTGAVRAHAT